MADKPGKVGGKKKVGSVENPNTTDKVESSDQVGQVGSIQRTGAISGVGAVGDRKQNRGTRTMTLAEREKIFEMVNEEAKKLFGKSDIPAEQREIIENAVKMAIDSGLTEEGDAD